MTLLNFQKFKNSDLEVQSQTLETLFERSKSLEKLTIANPSFAQNLGSNYVELVEKIRASLLDLCKQTGSSSGAKADVSDVIAAHPRLGQPNKVLSTHSAIEQRNLGNSDSQETLETLQRLNDQYEAKYPGLRFVVFVNGRTRPQIIQAMQSRILSGHSWLQEAQLACNEMCDIALDRIKKNVAPSTLQNKL
ncbi:LAFA_0G22430g1_1 [Lachancea sp. 'fantastica']|nr:LAFA_0G22430g1_1 [Lachancea sp. 'fantastica']